MAVPCRREERWCACARGIVGLAMMLLYYTPPLPSPLPPSLPSPLPSPLPVPSAVAFAVPPSNHLKSPQITEYFEYFELEN